MEYLEKRHFSVREKVRKLKYGKKSGEGLGFFNKLFYYYRLVIRQV